MILYFLLLSLFTAHPSFGQNDFKADATRKCLTGGGANITFLYTGVSSSSYKWDFGDGSPIIPSTNSNPTITYNKAGIFTITLTTDFDTLVKINYIQIFDEPTADIQFNASTLCSGPISVNLSANPSPDVTKYVWDFGDGIQDSSTANPTHFYAIGNYNISLIVKNNGGCLQTIVKNLKIARDITAQIGNSNPIICNAPGLINFTDQSSSSGNPVNNWTWDFGDTTAIETSQNPSHTYSKSGKYTVKLIAKNDQGCIDTVTSIVDVVISNVSNKIVSASQNTLCENEMVTFTTENSLYTMNWNFGDGSPISSVPNHKYTKAGTYSVLLTSTNTFGCSYIDTLDVLITIKSAPIPGYTYYKDTTCTYPIKLTFTDTTSNTVAWNWNFGDGNSSTSENPKHDYFAIGKYNTTFTVTYVNGCVVSRSDTIKVVFTDIVANFAVSPPTGCEGDTFKFFDISGVGVASQKWFFGDPPSGVNNSSLDPKPTHFYATNGNYTVTLIITDSLGCKDTLVRKNAVLVGKKSNPTFTVDPDSGCVPLTVTFTNSTPVDPSKAVYIWLFGDGGTSGEESPTYTYDTPGDFDVSLIISFQGCYDTLKLDSLIHVEPPDANFELDPPGDSSACILPHSIIIKDFSIGADEWFWDFGDGELYYGNDPDSLVHTYTVAGNYAISLIVHKFSNDCRDTLIKPDFIQIQSPVAEYYYDSSRTYCAPANIVFFNLSTPISNVSFLWDMDDGINDSVTTVHPVNNFTKPGIYDVKLKISMPNGCIDSIIKKIIVGGSTANFFADTLIGCAPLTVQFTDSSVIDSNIVSWLWEFGDGSTDTVKNPLHTFQSDGTFNVRLTVLDIGGCKSVKLKNNYIKTGNSGGNIVTDKTQVCEGEEISFTGYPPFGSNPPSSAYFWDFGDGNVKNERAPFYTYLKPGLFTVKLTIVDTSFGCNSVIVKNNLINVQRPTALFSADDTVLFCAPKSVQFTDSSLGAIKWFWDLGNTNTSIQKDPGTTYIKNGYYDVSLIVLDALDCADTLVKNDYIFIEGPIAKFTPDKTSGCRPLTVTYIDSSFGATSYYWAFGDLGNSDQKNPVHTFTNVGAFETFLEVTQIISPDTCIDKEGPLTINVYNLPKANFAVDSTWACRKLDAPFTNLSSIDVTKNLWNFGDGTIDSTAVKNFSHTFFEGQYDVNLLVENQYGCKDSILYKKIITVYSNPQANFLPVYAEACDTLTLQFQDISTTDTLPVVKWLWDFGDGTTDTIKNPKHFFSIPKAYKVKLVVENSKGCFNTIIRDSTVKIADSNPPAFRGIDFITVSATDAVTLNWTNSPDLDMDKYHIFFESVRGSGNFSELDSTKNISYIHKNLTPSTRSYCYYIMTIDTCGLSTIEKEIHCSIQLDVSKSSTRNGLDLSWTPYIGWTDSLLSYDIYRKDSSGYDLLITLDSSVLQHTDKPLCDVDYQYYIKANKSNSGFRSQSNYDHERPDYKQLVPKIDYSTVVDNLYTETHFRITDTLNNADHFVFSRSDNEGKSYIENFSKKNPDDLVLTDIDTKVDSFSYIYKTYLEDSCGYQSVFSNWGKTILLKAEKEHGLNNFNILISWTPYQQWDQGVSRYIIEQKIDESFMPIGETSGLSTLWLFEYKYQDLATYIFRVYAIENDSLTPNKSYSNEVEVVLPPSLFVPNAITLNDDGLNEIFEIKTLHIKEYRIVIFDRWGRKVFESTDKTKHWDGYYRNHKAIMDAYMFVIVAKGYNEKELLKYGSVTVIR